MVYVDGTMTIHGPGEGQGAIQDNAMINITANGDIIATGDVLYKTEPVSIPQDTLIPAAANMNQVLGLYTAVGNFITQDTQADQNIEVDGSIATISAADSANNCASGKGGQLSYGHINTFNNVGGMIQSCIYARGREYRKYLVRSPLHGPGRVLRRRGSLRPRSRKAVPLPVNTDAIHSAHPVAEHFLAVNAKPRIRKSRKMPPRPSGPGRHFRLQRKKAPGHWEKTYGPGRIRAEKGAADAGAVHAYCAGQPGSVVEFRHSDVKL